MLVSGLPGYYVLYSLFTISFLFLVRRKLQMGRRDTGFALAFIALFGIVLPVSIHVIGIWWTLVLVVLSASSVAASVIAVRMREDKELEGQIALVLKPEISILPVRESEDTNAFAPLSVQEVPHQEQADDVLASEPEEADSSKEGVEEREEQRELTADETEKGEVAEEKVEEEESEEATDDGTVIPPSSLTFSPEDMQQVQALYGNAAESLRAGDYFSAYRALKEALAFHPPVTAKTMIVQDLVRVLKEMGLYEESIRELQALLDELPSSASKKQAELRNQINVLQAVIQWLNVEQKPNLSWSLIPADILAKAERDVPPDTESTHPKENLNEAEQRNIG
jgi:tetratricopeptide (TPR) repeat protein